MMNFYIERKNYGNLYHCVGIYKNDKPNNIKAVFELLGHASIVVTSNHYFYKNKLIIDCTDVLNNYINRVKLIELLSDNLVPIVADLDTNFMVNRFV